MLWAIDVGNTQTVVAIHDGAQWLADWRFESRPERTEDELAGLVSRLCDQSNIPFQADEVIIASVVPRLDSVFTWFSTRYLGQEPLFLRDGAQVGIKVTYEPPTSVGADRIANALAALDLAKPPIVIVDFGTATTLDAIDSSGSCIGGSILPGIVVSMESLISRTAKLPGISLTPPSRVIGRNTTEALQSGIVLGYAGAVDTLVRRFTNELGGEVSVFTTGGLGEIFVGVCETLDTYHPMLTMDGLLKAKTILKGH